MSDLMQCNCGAWGLHYCPLIGNAIAVGPNRVLPVTESDIRRIVREEIAAHEVQRQYPRNRPIATTSGKP